MFPCKQRAIIYLVLVFLLGCGVKTKIQPLDGGGYLIQSKSDALVTVEKDKVTVDNRGQLSIVQQLIGMFLINTEQKDKTKIGE